MFPIGHLLKSEVRDLGVTYDLPNKARKDSQGICFLGKLKFDEFIRHYLGDQPGELIELETGKVAGVHKGFWYYTIGQRQGLGLAGGPWYVVSKDTKLNRVYISKNYYSEEKSRNELYVQSCNWLIEPDLTKTYKIKLRHGAKFNTGTIQKIESQLTQFPSSIDTIYKVDLTNRDQGIAPGQFVVFYEEEGAHNLCIGGGIIVDDPMKHSLV
jgi:tRNA-specific 2-thiouridylase